MKPPCVVVVLKVLPAIRAMVSKELVSKYGLSVSEVAVKMGLTEAAVSQYKSGVRGRFTLKSLERSPKTKAAVGDLTEQLSRDDSTIVKSLDKLCDACVAVNTEGVVSDLYSKLRVQNVQCKLSQAHQGPDLMKFDTVPPTSQSSNTIDISQDVVEELENFGKEIGVDALDDVIYEAIDRARAWNSARSQSTQDKQ
ncbi:MAG: transcriptional regulator [Candidatus Bathyarchaeia archaeon]